MNSELTTIPLSTSWAIPADSERARSLDRAVRGDYVRSVTHLLEVARARNFCSLPERWDPGRSWRSQIRLPPGGFLVYADLVQAFFRGDAEAAERLFLELAELRPVPIESPIVALDDAELVPHRERYERFMGFGDAGLEGVSPPPEKILSDFRSDYTAAMALIVRTMPELAGELRALLAQLVPVCQSPGSGFPFDGGSCYLLWGVVFLNIERRRSPVSLVEVLIHEASHLLLYAFAREEPLVRNGDEELYASPLRSDPRPMDGIVHATWVSARMHWAMRTLAEAAVEPGLREEAAAAAERDRLHFLEGVAVVRSHGRLTTTGSALIKAAAAYMGV